MSELSTTSSEQSRCGEREHTFNDVVLNHMASQSVFEAECFFAAFPRAFESVSVSLVPISIVEGDDGEEAYAEDKKRYRKIASVKGGSE